ncbi:MULTISPECIES: DUF2274 domain-containing protein [Bradyrhizobium]|uniref:DUF2274 domain-containing protein n=1 Tax=Bradyrhizobium TaxID=374 RepID=UPI00155F0A26|nr:MULTISPECIES: DUF2274 domain-containing protein [Bradyrhizobium]MDD1522463.1 DUF2274 domain-containing protein [Bradyrhizobium sp. WBAH30]MDD1546387.1 DUF2274 domain-containing protein [Bradyrhizobium sp. WBAH41]MDD1560954.1 DUF2274 domain-containing protein [Bradyrhizobium sp. WBAH23]MDD1567394.1 DUF2274 domain-containing protein [Bradyrhizobium sp. WBAH33]MDD1594056.1 DUF2274 domain-containing protein [Bradyrhizobium sp. WBAH42]
MPKLKIGTLTDNKPVRLTVDLPASVHRDLVAYAKALASESGQTISDPGKLIAPMLARFMATDRGFAKLRRAFQSGDSVQPKT